MNRIVLKFSHYSSILAFLTIIITFFSVEQWSTIKLSNFPLRVIIWSIFTVLIVTKKNWLINSQDRNLFYCLKLYLLWTIFCCIRGLFAFKGFIEFRHLIFGFFSCISPIFIIVFNKASLISYIYRIWFKYAILAFILYFYWQIGITQFYLSPLLILFCFFPLFPLNKRLIILLAVFLYCYSAGMEQRAQLVKGLISFIIGCITYYSQSLRSMFFKIGYRLGYFSVFFVFLFILTDFIGLISGKQSPYETNIGAEQSIVDSRSLLYLDVIESSTKHDYSIFGRTPARGRDIIYSAPLFYREDSDLNDFSRNERHFDEMLFPNIYTWEGIIGVILLSLVYFNATRLAIYKSNNNYIKLLGCFIAFRWAFGWIEDPFEFNISTISLCSMIGMCYSSEIRSMNSLEFKKWIRTIF